MKIIGIAGRMGSGKTTLAESLIRSGRADHHLSFASAIKEMCMLLYELDPNIRSAHNRKAWQITGNGVREMCQQIQGHKNVWIDLALRKAQDQDPNGTFVISDMRYLNEMEQLLEHDHKVIYIIANDHIRKRRIEERDKLKITLDQWTEWGNHPSEKESDLIYNYVNTHAGFGAHVYVNSTQQSLQSLHENFIKWFDQRGIGVNDGN